MTVTVLLFASYAEAMGTSSVTLDLPTGSRVGDAVEAIRGRSSGPLPPKPLVAVNEVYATIADLLSAGDEVAIIPPVAGG